MIEAVEIAARDGSVLRGELIRRGADWIVLVHDRGADLDAWAGLRHVLAGEGMSVLAYDLRGHGGSDGDPDPGRTEDDLEDVLEFASRNGAERLLLGAAGASVPPAVAAGAERALGLFAIDPPATGVPEAPSLRKLVIVREGAPAPPLAGFSLTVHVPDPAAGHALLQGGWARSIEASLLRFLRDARLATVPR